MIWTKKTCAVIIFFMMIAAITEAQRASIPPAPEKKHKFNELAPQKGFYWSAEWNGQYGGTRNYVDHIHFGIHFKGNLLNRNAAHINLGYLFNPHLYLGGGTGVEYQDRGYGDITSAPGLYLYVGALWVVPVYGEIRGYLFNKPTTPFLQLRLGYAPSVYVAEKRSTVENSSYNNLSVGVRIFNHVSVTLGYLFMYQQAILTGYDKDNNSSPLIDRSHPYEHYCTVGLMVNFKSKKDH